MIWTGKKTTAGPIAKSTRDCNNIPVYYRAIRRSMGQMQVDGRTEYVHRLVFKILTRPEHEFHMRNICGNTLCANPKHWDVTSEMPEVVIDTSEWTKDEVLDAVEMFLTRYEPETWDDVIVNPLLQDIPLPMIRECLIDLNKEHLT